MILGTILRTHVVPEMAPWDKLYFICENFEKVYTQLGVNVFPVFTEWTLPDLDEYCRVCDGLILPGSAKNVYPEYYGCQRDPEATYSVDEYIYDKPIVEAFIKAGKPVLGICGGLQVLNVMHGGTLIQRRPGHGGTRHEITIEKDSFLERVYQKDRVEVNSYHGQCIDQVAPGFRVTARAADGTIEAIEKDNIVAVQWHPEVDVEMDFFRTFIKEFF